MSNLRLVREVPVARRRDDRYATWLYDLGRCAFWAAAITAAIAAIGPRPRMVFCTQSRPEIAWLEIKRYVDEAFPLWHRQRPGATCPPDLSALNPFTNRGPSILDPWSRPYAYTCVDGAIRVVSGGDDGRFGTEDDLDSDDR